MTGWVDLQVNGYAGVDFNSETLNEAAMIRACQRLRADGVEQCLVTIITAPIAAMTKQVERIVSWIDSQALIRSVVAGLHLEGPFLSPHDGFVGAHPKAAVIPADLDTTKQLLASGCGHVRLLTLAPECDQDAAVTRFLTRQGVVVAAGHSDASLEQLDRCIDAGLKLFTHLGNGCPAVQARHDNIIQRVLSRSDRLWISFIADGHHVPLFALKNYLACIPSDKIIIVSDAISAAGLGPGSYPLAGQTVHVDDDGAAWAECRTHFAGCATPMKRMRQILRDHAGVNEATLDTWMRTNPLRLMDQSPVSTRT
ncbi:N-acetylglucosamine-6-phosphate deacetylase [Novipirellula artificiosorum]|uniref:N-acetylglucosamine-6-phosphate deacetylase n=1 Tax=Novipirellula artificiosorum TaxID=2528016 RepID=A0A5C6DW29_9BACT|nr:N-acetylglucosamine-6-phosphate deacetylase [Novipirellula artificiosorum]TWU40868.1 N-acetylglucosamine-6-phosphate deacetylase [Novipirellula artificiosorum]